MKARVHIGVMDDLFMHIDQEGESSCDPIVVFFADCDIDQFFLGNEVSNLNLVLLERKKLEDERNAVSRLQEECVVLSDHIISFRLSVITV